MSDAQIVQIAKEFLDQGEDLELIAERLGIPKFKLLYALDQAGITVPVPKAADKGKGKAKPSGGRILGMRRSALNRLERKSEKGADTTTDKHAQVSADASAELLALRAENAELRRKLELLTTTVLGYAEGLAGRLKQDADEVGKLVKSIRKKR